VLPKIQTLHPLHYKELPNYAIFHPTIATTVQALRFAGSIILSSPIIKEPHIFRNYNTTNLPIVCKYL
jgi:hypothetical protein